MNTNDLKNDAKDDLSKAGNAVGLTSTEEPATGHDVKEGGILGAVGGAVVGMLAGGPIGAVVGAVAGGAASAAAVNVVDKHDNDYGRTVGAEPVSTYTGTDTTTASPSAYGTNLAQNTSDLKTGEGAVIPIIEEELEVGKRQVQSGGARIRTSVIETPVAESVILHEERVTVDRYAVDQPVVDAATAFKEQTFEVTETNEVPVVAKTARVVEEVVVGKTATDRTETIRDTVRRTDVEVEELDADAKARR